MLFFYCKQLSFSLATHFYSFLKEWKMTSIAQYSSVSSGMIMLCIICASCLSSDNHALYVFLLIKKKLCLYKILQHLFKMEYFPLTGNLVLDFSECTLWKACPAGAHNSPWIFLLMYITASNTTHLLLFWVSFL